MSILIKIILIIIALILCAFAIIPAYLNSISWNKGKCKKCGTKWIYQGIVHTYGKAKEYECSCKEKHKTYIVI